MAFLFALPGQFFESDVPFLELLGLLKQTFLAPYGAMNSVLFERLRKES